MFPLPRSLLVSLQAKFPGFLCRSRKLIWAFLIFFGICHMTWIGNLFVITNQSMLQRHKRCRYAVKSPRYRSYTVREILNFPKDYHTKGVLSLPYGDIVEPFEAWYSGESKMSRIDYYGGMDQTYQREQLGKHGFACKVVPEFSENNQKTFRGCLHRRGTKKFPVKAQSIVPTSHYFKYVGDVILRGRRSAKWEHTFTIYNKVNTYILYTTKSRNVKPLRYEMMGYDTLLSSYYDHYILDYELFEPWIFNYSTFQIPTAFEFGYIIWYCLMLFRRVYFTFRQVSAACMAGIFIVHLWSELIPKRYGLDLDCFDFTRKKFASFVGELNPMLEFMPHTDNGAPFTLSHEPMYADDSSKIKELKGYHQSENNSYRSKGLDASLYDNKELIEDGNGMVSTDYERTSPGNDDTLIRNIASSSNYVPESITGNIQPSSYENTFENMNEDAISSSNLQRKLPYHRNLIYNGYTGSFPNKQPNHNELYEPGRPEVYESLRLNGLFRPSSRKNTKLNSKGLMSEMLSHLSQGRNLYSWGNSKQAKHDVRLLKKHTFTFKKFNKKRLKRKKHRKNYSNRNFSKHVTTSPNFKVISRKNYEDIVNILFEAFKLDHKKAYSSDHEHETRKDIYRHNLRFIMSRNRMHLGYKLRPNHLMDMTDNEIQQQKGLLEENINVFNGGVPFKPVSHHIPKFVDWRKRGAVNSVRSQGICGSCYAYAVTGALEGAYFLKNGHLPDLSEQEIIDCSWGFGNRGCKGGYPYRAMQWILKHGGLATDDSYGKYLAQEGYCHFQNVTAGVTLESYMNISKENGTELKQALAQYGPVSVLISTQPKSFKFYSSGIYYDPECGTNLDHAALAVGYGVHHGTPYWLIKNSWSKAWGDSGYIKIAERGSSCGVTSKAVVVKIK